MPVLGGQESQVILGLYIPESNRGGKELKKKKRKQKIKVVISVKRFWLLASF